MLNNIFDLLPNLNSIEEEFLLLLETKSLKIERIVSSGQCSPSNFWYEQEQNEWIVVLEGEAVLSFEDSDLVLQKGDFVNIPAYQKHRVKSTQEDNYTIWIAIFYDSK